jgi:hypothetical protein
MEIQIKHPMGLRMPLTESFLNFHGKRRFAPQKSDHSDWIRTLANSELFQILESIALFLVGEGAPEQVDDLLSLLIFMKAEKLKTHAVSVDLALIADWAESLRTAITSEISHRSRH